MHAVEAVDGSLLHMIPAFCAAATSGVTMANIRNEGKPWLPHAKQQN
jgi:hypothetical protein